jgi:hypothetical protein
VTGVLLGLMSGPAWQLWVVAGLVPVAVAAFGFTAGAAFEWGRSGGSRDLGERLETTRGQLHDSRVQVTEHWLAGEEARDAAGEARAAAEAEHRRADREYSRRRAAEAELAELRAAAYAHGRAVAHVAEVVDIAAWYAARPTAAELAQPPP